MLDQTVENVINPLESSIIQAVCAAKTLKNLKDNNEKVFISKTFSVMDPSTSMFAKL